MAIIKGSSKKIYRAADHQKNPQLLAQLAVEVVIGLADWSQVGLWQDAASETSRGHFDNRGYRMEVIYSGSDGK